AVIKVNEDVSFKFGFLLQPQADWLQNPANDSYSQNLFLRRARLIVGGQVAKNVTFFFETDSPNLGKVVNGAKVTTGMIVQDAFLSWKLADEFTVDAGLILTGISHNSLQSAASLISIDYGPHSFLYSAAEQNVVGRDTGFQVRGYPARKKLEYRVGVWQGARDSASRNALRTTARLQYNFLDADTGFFYTGTSLGKKKIFAIGAGCDAQKDYKAYAADVYVDHPLGPGAISGQIDWTRLDGGDFVKTLLKQDVIFGEFGYYFPKVKVMPYFSVSNKDVASTDTGDETRWSVGLGYMAFGHNFNIKAAYGRIDPKVGKSADQFTVQMQAFYF
ncbi:MAG TPA: porin, partial [Thermoanaerobaculia bacterium]|nr:porin [Thermoanaerobaculia bacterium]